MCIRDSEYGLSDDQFIPYGRDKAKVALDTSNPKGKLILVTATSGMPAGSGTVSYTHLDVYKRQGYYVLPKTSESQVRRTL